jgi:hypothetical protein
MDSDSNKEKYYTSAGTEDNEEPNPSSRWSSSSQPPSPDFSASSSEDEVTWAEMFAFLALTLQMGHIVQGSLEDFWMKMEQVCCPFYGQMMIHAGYYHILRFLHFTDVRNGVYRTDNRLIWNSKDELFRNLQPFRTFGSRWSHCEIQGKGSTVHPEKTQSFLHQNI